MNLYLKTRRLTNSQIAEILILAAAFGILSYISISGYLLFHSLAEVFSIIIGFTIFIIAWNTKNIIKNNYLLFIGISYLFISFLDLLHTFSFKGTGIIAVSGANVPTQYWISARYLESFSLLIATQFINRRLNLILLSILYLVITIFIVLSISYFKFFPVSYIEGYGLTLFKKVSEYIIIVILIGTILILYRNKLNFDHTVFIFIILSLIATSLSEFSFTLYFDVTGIFNALGHFLKILSFYFIYKALIEIGLSRPYDFLFRRLNKRKNLLIEQTKNLKILNRDLDAFSYTLSHDLRKQLRIIDGYETILSQDYGHLLDDKGMEYLKNIKTSVYNSSKLINSVLKLYQISKNSLSFEEVNLSELALELIEQQKKAYPDVKIECNVQDNMILLTDRDLLKIMLENLLENAGKFIRESVDPKIEIGRYIETGKTIYFIRDNGMGMEISPFKNPKKNFLMLRSRKILRKYESFGIGLSTVKKVIRILNGDIWVDSELGKGTTFYFTFH